MAKEEFSVKELCLLFEVSRSGFYAHLRKPFGKRQKEDRELAEEVRRSFVNSRQTYGTPRIRLDLQDQGKRCGRRRIGRLMREQELQARQKRRFIPRTTDSSHRRPVAPHRLMDRPAPSRPQEVWVTDITYIPTREGWLFLAAEIDLFSRRVVGWHAADHMETSLVLGALNQAISRTSGSLAGLIHHSDQGSQYASSDFTQALSNLALTQSMSRRGNCYDNAVTESFWATLKTECFNNVIPATRSQAKSMIFDYIETFYNPVRRHSSLRYLSPINFEKQLIKN